MCIRDSPITIDDPDLERWRHEPRSVPSQSRRGIPQDIPIGLNNALAIERRGGRGGGGPPCWHGVSPRIASAGYVDQANLMRLGSVERAYGFRRRLQDHVAAFLLEIVSGLWRQLNVSLLTGAYDDNIAGLFKHEFGLCLRNHV